MIRVVLIGGGNIAYHLANHFLKNDLIDLVQVCNRNLDSLKFLGQNVRKTNDLSNLSEADIYVLAVSDDAIAKVSKRMTNVRGLVVHTSGGKNLSELQGDFDKGVLYFPQSFTKGVPADFSKVPVCLETKSANDMPLLRSLAQTFTDTIVELNSKQRSYLHVSAVFVNNFVNHMYAIGNELCETHDIPFELLHPIIQGTVDKIQKIAPLEAQTGPAIRKDQKTIEKHKALLETHQKEIYTMLTKSIQHYGEKL